MKPRRVLGLPVLLLTTTGRKTGKQHTTPLGYFAHGKAFVVTASNGGKASNPDWFYNLRSHPSVHVEFPDSRWEGKAKVAPPALRRTLWAKLIQLAPSYEGFQKRTKRLIPMVLLRPNRPGQTPPKGGRPKRTTFGDDVCA